MNIHMNILSGGLHEDMKSFKLNVTYFLGAQKCKFLMISGDLRASPASFSAISARSSAKQMINKWCEALSSISHVLGSRRAKSQHFRFSVISELYIEI